MKYQVLNKRQPIVVTGGAGYIGTEIVSLLLRKGFSVRIYDQFMFGDEVIADLKKNPRLSVIKGDISNVSLFAGSLQGAQAVVHLAGVVGDPACLVDEEFTKQMNIVSTRIVKDMVQSFGIARLVFASSCSVYGVTNKLATERSPLRPVSLYARTKLDSENELLNNSHHRGSTTILRFATVFGRSRRQRFDLVANLFAAQAYHAGKITVSGSRQYRPFIHVADIARAVYAVLSAPQKKVSQQIFNVGDQRLNVSIGELAAIVRSIIQKDKHGHPVTVVINDDISDRRNYRVSFAKILKTLDFRASETLESGITELYRKLKAEVYPYDYRDPHYVNAEMTKLIALDVKKTNFPE